MQDLAKSYLGTGAPGLTVQMQQKHFPETTVCTLRNAQGEDVPGRIYVRGGSVGSNGVRRGIKAEITTGWKRFVSENGILQGMDLLIRVTAPQVLTITIIGQPSPAGDTARAAAAPPVPAVSDDAYMSMYGSTADCGSGGNAAAAGSKLGRKGKTAAGAQQEATSPKRSRPGLAAQGAVAAAAAVPDAQASLPDADAAKASGDGTAPAAEPTPAAADAPPQPLGGYMGRLFMAGLSVLSPAKAASAPAAAPAPEGGAKAAVSGLTLSEPAADSAAGDEAAAAQPQPTANGAAAAAGAVEGQPKERQRKQPPRSARAGSGRAAAKAAKRRLSEVDANELCGGGDGPDAEELAGAAAAAAAGPGSPDNAKRPRQNRAAAAAAKPAGRASRGRAAGGAGVVAAGAGAAAQDKAFVRAVLAAKPNVVQVLAHFQLLVSYYSSL